MPAQLPVGRHAHKPGVGTTAVTLEEEKNSWEGQAKDSCDALGFCAWERGNSGCAVSVMSLGAGEAPEVDAE